MTVTISPAATMTLDVVRGGSALAVVVGHGLSFGNLSPGFAPPHFPWIQELAVVGFFWMSGFLIMSTLDRGREGAGSFLDFMVARWVRIFVPLVPALVLTWVLEVLVDVTVYSGSRTVPTLVGNAFMLHAVPGLGVPVFASNRPLWTVGIEWWLYVCAGVAILRPRSLIAWGAFSIGCLVVVANLKVGRGSGLVLVWALGAIGWRLYQAGTGRWILVPGVTLLCAAVARWLSVAYAYDMVAEIAFGAGASACIAYLRGARMPRRLVQTAGWFAAPSYSLYLVHYPVMVAFGQPFTGSDLVVYMVSSLVLAGLFYLVFERPRRHIQAVVVHHLRRVA